MQTLIRDVRAGLVTPSALSVMVMILTLLVLTLSSAALLPRLMRSDLAALLAADRTDHHLYATSEIYRLRASDDTRPLVAILGASVTRSSFGRTRQVEAELRAATGRDYEVVNLATGRQSLLETLELVDALPDDRPVLAVLGLGPSRLTRDRHDYEEIVAADRFGFGSATFGDDLAALGLPVPGRTGIELLDQRRYYAPRLILIPRNIAKLALGRSIRQNETEYVGRKAGDAEFRARSELVMSRFDPQHPAAPMSLHFLQLLLDKAASDPELSLVLFEHPVNPIFVADYLGADSYARHLQMMRDIAAREGVPYWTLGLDAELGPEAFYDWAHVASAEAQARMRAILVERLSAIIAKQPDHG